ncbi:MAG: hypothetical protein PHN59_04460, partial [Candidatus Omnitrophica bacterium]|nr:hypothetical protein [Candidatus Omnitrophota bacterium]
MEGSKTGQGLILETRKPTFRPWMRFLSLLIIFTFFFQVTHIGYLYAQEGEGGGDEGGEVSEEGSGDDGYYDDGTDFGDGSDEGYYDDGTDYGEGDEGYYDDGTDYSEEEFDYTFEEPESYDEESSGNLDYNPFEGGDDLFASDDFAYEETPVEEEMAYDDGTDFSEEDFTDEDLVMLGVDEEDYAAEEGIGENLEIAMSDPEATEEDLADAAMADAFGISPEEYTAEESPVAEDLVAMGEEGDLLEQGLGDDFAYEETPVEEEMAYDDGTDFSEEDFTDEDLVMLGVDEED